MDDSEDIFGKWLQDIRDLYRSKLADELAHILAASCGKWSRRRQAAIDFMRRHNLRTFVEQSAKGLAPRIGQATAAVCVEPVAVPVACAGSKRPL